MVSILKIGICIVTILSVKCQDLRVRLVLEKGTDKIFFQGFNWESAKHSGPWYKVMLDVASELSQAGITDVWFPPPSDSSSLEGYLPRRLYDLTSSYGNKDKLKQVIQTFHENGIRCISDIVINHRSAEKRDASGYWCIFYGGRDGKLDWGPSSIVKDDETCMDSSGQPDTGVNYPHSPDIDHLNKTVQSELVEWLTWLKTDIGFDGWRFDFAKGYGASFARNYFEKSAAEFAVAEIWDDMSYDYNRQLSYNQDSHRQQIINWIDNTQGTISAFDFTTKGILQQAVKDELWRLVDSNRKPAGVIGWWPEKAVTFVDNHDTGSTQNLWPFPSDKVMQGYAYILTHPGIPCIFWDHFFDWGLKNEILALINIRKRNGINSSSKLHILAAEYNMYVADVDDKVRMKIGSRYDIGYLVPSPEVYDMVAFGNDYCVWQKKFNRVHSQVPY